MEVKGMTIKNESSVTVSISGRKVEPGKTGTFYEAAFDTHNVNTIGGYVIITTEYSQRYFECFGCIEAVEGGEIDPETNLHEIIIRDKAS